MRGTPRPPGPEHRDHAPPCGTPRRTHEGCLHHRRQARGARRARRPPAPRQEPALDVEAGRPGPVRAARPPPLGRDPRRSPRRAPANAAGAPGRARPRRGLPWLGRRPRPRAPGAPGRDPDPGAGRPPARRLLLAGVRRLLDPSAVLRRPRDPGRRSPEGGVGPRRAARRRRPALRARLLPPVALRRRPPAGRLRSAARGRAAARPRARRRPPAGDRGDRAADDDDPRPDLAGAGRPRPPAPPRHGRGGERRGGADDHGPPLRRVRRAPAEAGDPPRGRRRPRARRVRLRPRGLPHERGARRLPRARADEPADPPRHRSRRGADRRPRGHRVHDAHAGSGRHRPVRRRPDRALRLLVRARPRAAELVRPAARTRAGRGGRPAGLQHGLHGPAPGAARQRRLRPPRRGLPADVREPLARIRGARGADRPHHERGPRGNLDVRRVRLPVRTAPRLDRLDRPRGLGADPLRPRRGDLVRPPAVAAAPRDRRPAAGPRGVGGAGRAREAARLGRVRPRSGRADDRVRPPRAVLQAPDADPARARTPGPAPPRRGPAGPVRDRGQGPPGRRARQAPDLRARELRGRSEGAPPDHVPPRLRHDDGRDARRRGRRLAEQSPPSPTRPAAPPG